ncbi:hypothetical protein DOY81_010776 [Sarcophaga bullata]|nr:hypothetical protein DOY81_010776 [Sarcophaga bullata]
MNLNIIMMLMNDNFDGCPRTDRNHLQPHSRKLNLSGCPRANKPKSKPRDGQDSEPLRGPIPGCDGSGHSTGKFLSTSKCFWLPHCQS